MVSSEHMTCCLLKSVFQQNVWLEGHLHQASLWGRLTFERSAQDELQLTVKCAIGRQRGDLIAENLRKSLKEKD